MGLVPLEEEEETAEFLSSSCEDTGRRYLSARQEIDPHQEVYLPVP